MARLLADAVQPATAEVSQRSAAFVERRLAIVQKLAGSLKAPADFDYKKELEDGLAEKYGV